MLQNRLLVLGFLCALAACANSILSKSGTTASGDAVVKTPAPVPAATAESTQLICGFLVVTSLVPPGATGVCAHQVFPVLFINWSQERVYAFYGEVARQKHWLLTTKYVPKPVNHSVPVSYYDYLFNITEPYRIDHVELYPAAGGTGIKIWTSSRFGGVSGNGPRPGQKSLVALYNGIPITAPFSRFITAENAANVAEGAVLAEGPRGSRTDAYWVALERFRNGDYIWDARVAAGGALYSTATLVYFVKINALTGAVLSMRAERNAPGLPIPPNPTQPPAMNRATPRSIARPALPADADEPISKFSQTFKESLTLPPGYGYKDAYVVEVKLLPYGVAQRQLHTGVIAFDIDTARMYVIVTILVPHPFYPEESVPAGAHLCERAYAVIHISKDAMTGAPGFGELSGPCKATSTKTM